jgi:hypothetical protein
MKLEEIVRAGLSRVDVIGVKRTAINPLLWLIGIIAPLSLILAVIVANHLASLILFGFAAIPIIFTLVVYVVYMMRDPDRLQSEEYRIKQQALRYLYKKGGSTEIVNVANQEPRVETSHSLANTGDKE